MTRITKLSEDYGLNAATLEGRGVYTVDDLWACIGHNVDQGITKVAAETNMAHDALLAFLIVDVLEDPRRSSKPNPFGLWLGLKPLWRLLKKFGTFIKRSAQNRNAIWSKVKEHRYGFDLFWVVPKSLLGRTQTAWGTRGSLWPDLILVGLPLLVLALVIRAQVLNERVVQRVALKPGVTLPAFSAIDTEKLTTRSVINQPGSFASIDDLRRRYPIKDLASNELVNEQQLLPTSMSYLLAGRSLATLPISGSIGASIQPMQRVKLILASREKEKPGVVIEDVILLAVEKQADSTFVTVALTSEAVASIQSLAGLSSVFVLEKLD